MKLTVIAYDKGLIIKSVIIKGKFKDIFLKALNQKKEFENQGLNADIFLGIDTKKAQPYLRINSFFDTCNRIDFYINERRMS